MSLTSEQASSSSARAVSELWYTRCPVPTASSLAISQGWLDDEFAPDGITVASLRASVETAVRESHFDHTQGDSFRQGGNIPPIWTRSRGSDVRLIGLSWAEQYQAIVTLPGNGIDGPADLAGKRLALARRVNDQIDFHRATVLRGYDSTLRHVGLSLDDVTLVDLPVAERYLPDGGESHSGSLFGAYTNRRLQSTEVLALIRGEVDAIYIAGGRGPDLEALAGVHVVFDIQAQDDPALKINNITPATLTVSGVLLDERPDLVARYLAATLRAADWARENPVQTRRIIAHEVGIAEDFVLPGYPREIHANLTPSLDEDLVAAIESQQAFLLAHGFIENAFDVRAWVDPAPLQAARELLAAEA
ncbi:ABC transporter substrate-binding protein [Conexibacter sp. CPCC 206217]|uniref:ABC transporter substrate-binding protein n=1 Tax=Conexibacter sp. CPCC 206217 TaxID=3064574 RepID=UPI0027163CC3|nr:ABC transporter substrate-binding protein [Conexibacter sp. CPCC 206217]MDO8211678.1 ABC transporter substrate-binding protein [Conexibacter sp. CPCC 206217]